MKLIVVRHAAAVERSSDISEEIRYLTPEGRVFFRKTARTMLKNGVEPGLILTSPLLRAVQTADILAEALSYSGPFMVRDELRPGFDRQGLNKLLDDYRSVDEMVLVGHEPDLSNMVSFLISRPGGFNFRKGAAIKLKIDPSNLPVSTAFKWLA
ncbi:MAG: histidine phosphatase family protein, partial [Geobacteraceae bacterium]